MQTRQGWVSVGVLAAAVVADAAAAYAPSTDDIEHGCASYADMAREVAERRDAGEAERALLTEAMATDDPLWLDRTLALIATVYAQPTMRPHDLAFAVRTVCLEDGGW